jgi:hypothetical protein
MGTDATRPPWETQWFSQGYRDILNDNGKYTWDIPYLNQYEGHYVFVYGTLRRGGSNHLVLSGNTKNVFGGVAVTSSARWDMWVADTGAGKPRFPVMLYSGDKTVYRVGSMNEAGKYLVWVEGLRGAAMYNFRFVPHKKGGFGAFLERHSL